MDKEALDTVAFKVAKALVQEIDQMAAGEQRTRSAMLRVVVLEGLKALKQRQPNP